MKSLLIATVTIAPLLFASAEESQQATLTLKGDQVLLETTTEIIKYPVTKVPGFSTIKFKPKISIQGDKEINISEVTFENKLNGEKLLLIDSKPTKVIWDSQTSSWKPAPQK
jgi:hypothetical protein